MNIFRILSLVTALALPVSLVADTQSSKLNPGPKNTITPAKANADNISVSSSIDDHEAVKSLSPKNKKVYSTFSTDDQKKVKDAVKKGKDPHTQMVEILKNDQKKNGKKHNKKEDSGFIWEDNPTPALKRGS
tara:strand:- start:355 stop:750 length:396 start_codon:yes stop_codon:yes gene_type:complete